MNILDVDYIESMDNRFADLFSRLDFFIFSLGAGFICSVPTSIIPVSLFSLSNPSTQPIIIIYGLLTVWFVFWIIFTLCIYFYRIKRHKKEVYINSVYALVDNVVSTAKVADLASKHLSEKVKVVGALADEVISGIRFGIGAEETDKNYEAAKKIHVIYEAYLFKTAQSFKAAQLMLGQPDVQDYPGIEAELEALLDVAKTGLLLENTVPNTGRALNIIYEFNYPTNEGINKKLKDLLAIKNDITNLVGHKYKNDIADNLLIKIAQSIIAYKRTEKGLIEVNPRFEAELEVLLDEAKAALILAIPEVEKISKTNHRVILLFFMLCYTLLYILCIDR